MAKRTTLRLPVLTRKHAHNVIKQCCPSTQTTSHSHKKRYKWVEGQIWRTSRLHSALKYSITKGASTYVFCFLRSDLGFVFAFNTSRQKEERRTHKIHKHKTPLRGEEMKGETRLLCHWVCWAQIIPSICLCWTCIPLFHPHSPSIKHCFIRLHPCVQLG